jgi:hypothetical protein
MWCIVVGVVWGVVEKGGEGEGEEKKREEEEGGGGMCGQRCALVPFGDLSPSYEFVAFSP